MNIEVEFKSLIAILEAEKIDYAVVGGFAVAIWGAPRATTDIDLLVRPSDVDQVLGLVRALGYDLEAAPMTFQDGMQIRRVTRIDDAEVLTLDLLLVNANLEDVWKTRSTVLTEAGPVCVVSREGLIRMKIAANRPQDISDVARLREQDR